MPHPRSGRRDSGAITLTSQYVASAARRGDPHTPTLIKVDKIHRTLRLFAEAIENDVMFTAARETMNCTGADIRNRQLFRGLQGKAVGCSRYAWPSPRSTCSRGGIKLRFPASRNLDEPCCVEFTSSTRMRWEDSGSNICLEFSGNGAVAPRHSSNPVSLGAPSHASLQVNDRDIASGAW